MENNETSRPVTIVVVLSKFHSLSERARVDIGGVHNVDFYIQVRDAVTGEALTENSFIEADLHAYSLNEYKAQAAPYLTMKQRITGRIAEVVATWIGLATGSDRVAESTAYDIGL